MTQSEKFVLLNLNENHYLMGSSFTFDWPPPFFFPQAHRFESFACPFPWPAEGHKRHVKETSFLGEDSTCYYLKRRDFQQLLEISLIFK